MEQESLERLLEQGLSVERIAKRFGKERSTVSYWMGKFGLEAPKRAKYAARGGIERARLVELVSSGATTREIANEIDRSLSTVRYWLQRYGLRTAGAKGRRPREHTKQARHSGLLTITSNCRHHGETEFFLEERGYYRCKRCRGEAVVRRRRKVKEMLVQEAGGCCCICGYDRHVSPLHFHHLDPEAKRMGLSARGIGHAIEKLRKEAAKCVLLCSNCHAEVEHGATQLPLDLQELLKRAVHRNPG